MAMQTDTRTSSRERDENSKNLKLPNIAKTVASAKSLRDASNDSNSCDLLETKESPRQKKKVKENAEMYNIEKTDAEREYARLQEIFLTTDNDGVTGLNISEFKEAIKDTVGHHLTEDQIETLFMKVDANCDGVVDWEEYVTYNLLEYQERNQMIDMMRENPFPPETREVRSRHRDTIVRVAFFPSIQKRTTYKNGMDYTNGRYVSLSKEGAITFWTLKMRRIRSLMTHAYVDRATQPWLTDMVCMYNVNMLAVTSTDRDIIIFDLQANKFQKRYYITGIESCITTMAYWADLKDLDKAVMAWGDTSGNIFVFKFDSALRGGPFGAVSGKNNFKRVSMAEVIRGFFLGVKGYKLGKIHDNWVSQITYVPILDCVLSCCQHSNTSMFLGDFEKKKLYTTFKVSKGILGFDYCESNNIIVTGGMDYLVRVWNPYVNNKAIIIMKGHSKPVTHIVINSPKNQIISVDKGRNIRVFDMKDQTCIQQLNGRFVKLGPFSISTMCFNPALQTLILATNQLAMLERHIEEENRIEVTSHNKPIVSALYNRIFRFVVSVCLDSVVSVWDIRTGEKVIQFINAHKQVQQGVEIPVEITEITFDGPERRLITAARDGSVKVWNFNNGACLQTFQTPEGLDITGLISTRDRIYVTGWCRVVHVYVDGGGEEYRKQWSCKHKEDILCMAYQSPNIVATGSYDGDIVVWSRDTGRVYCTLNAFKGIKPISDNTKKMDFSSDLDENETPSLLENLTPLPLDDADETAKAHRKSIKSLRAGVGLLQKVRDSCFRVENRSSKQYTTGSDTACEHPLLPVYDEQFHTPTPTEEPKPKRYGYDEICKTYEASVEKILFLEKRETLDKDTAVLISSGAEGWIRAWSIHHQGGLLGQFNAAHKIGEDVHALATDPDNHYLLTGDTLGYLKIWDITEYCTKRRHMPKDREARWQYLLNTFTFLRFESQFQDGVPKSFTSRLSKPEDIWRRPPPLISNPKKTLKWPLLVSSFRAHTKVINSIAFVEEFNLICTNSADCSIRLWTLGGQYIGTFGEQWGPLTKESLELLKPRLPRDLRRSGSARTLKVLNCGRTPMWKNAFEILNVRGIPRIETPVEQISKMEKTEYHRETTEKKLKSSEILGKAYKRKVRHKIRPTIQKFVETQTSVAVYRSLPFVELSPVDHFQSQEVMGDLKCRRYGATVRDRLRGVKKKEYEPALVTVFNKLVSKPPQHPVKHKVKATRMNKVISQMRRKEAGYENGSDRRSDSKSSKHEDSWQSDATVSISLASDK